MNPGGWIPLNLIAGLANTVEDIDRNIESALGRSYIRYQDVMGTESGAVSVVGSGPSLKRTWKQLRDFDGDIIACNAACQFLLERGIVPKYMMCFDADPLMLEFVTPHPDITYLFASRCPPKAFDMLEGCRVVMWHTNGDKNIESLLLKHNKIEAMVAGGTAAITRGMMLAQPLGYQEIHLWGADSSFHEGDTHIRKSTTVEKHLQVSVGGRQFWCAPWMAQQAEDFKILAPQLRDLYGVKLVVHGDGLIPHLARIMNFEVHGEPKYKHVLRHAKYGVQRLWQHL